MFYQHHATSQAKLTIALRLNIGHLRSSSEVKAIVMIWHLDKSISKLVYFYSNSLFAYRIATIMNISNIVAILYQYFYRLANFASFREVFHLSKRD